MTDTPSRLYRVEMKGVDVRVFYVRAETVADARERVWEDGWYVGGGVEEAHVVTVRWVRDGREA